MEAGTNTSGQKRLIVLLPEYLAGNLELANKVYWLGIREHREILYLTLVDESERRLTVSRSMATMRAVTSGNGMPVTAVLIETSTWINALKGIFRPGDVIVCQDEQTVKDGFFRTIPLRDFLVESFDTTVIPLSGFYQPQNLQVKTWLKEMVFWAGALFLMAGFFTIDIHFARYATGIARTALAIIGIALELGAILAWSRIIHG
jgi:hypothetical protein